MDSTPYNGQLELIAACSLIVFYGSLGRSLNSAPGVEYDQVLNHSGTFLGQWL